MTKLVVNCERFAKINAWLVRRYNCDVFAERVRLMDMQTAFFRRYVLWA